MVGRRGFGVASKEHQDGGHLPHAASSDCGWLEPEPLCSVNSTAEEFSPSFVQTDGVTMLYFWSNRTGLHKIDGSVLQENGTWGTLVRRETNIRGSPRRLLTGRRRSLNPRPTIDQTTSSVMRGSTFLYL